jgi:hypothetical protein
MIMAANDNAYARYGLGQKLVDVTEGDKKSPA